MESVATVDFESRSAVSLRTVGTWTYSRHPTTEILCLAFRLPHWAPGRTALWHPPFPHLGMAEADCGDDVLELIDWITSGGLVEAHNAFFERCMWMNILAPRYGWPEVPHRSWRCSAAKMATHALPRGLEDAGAALKVPVTKDITGAALMKKLMKPRKPRKKEREAWLKTHSTLDGMPLLWHESREWFERLFDYCQLDVLAEEAISKEVPDLSPEEVEVYLLDQAINIRGFQIDPEAVDTALYLLEQEGRTLNAELTSLTDGTVTKATQRAKLLAWFNENGLEDVFDTTAETVDEELRKVEGQPITPPTRALQILRMLGRSSTAKYEKMRDQMDPDDARIRGGLLYHGATTGRWAGSGVQPHNFPKGSIKGFNMEEAWGILQSRNRQQIVAKYPSVMEALSQGLRGAIVAGPGMQLYVADYASIEARVVLWLAYDDEALDVFRRGEDIYLDMATDIYKYPCNKKDHPHERQIGKFACLGPNTLVLTHNGPKRIVEVTLHDYLWDGVAWVSHEGTICNGNQKVIDLAGILLTPDHLVLTGTHWSPANEVAQNADTLSRALGTASVLSPSWDMSRASAKASAESWSSVTVETPTTASRDLTSWGENLRAVTSVPNGSQRHTERSIGGTRISFPTPPIGSGCLIDSAPSIHAARIPPVRIMQGMAAGVFASVRSGWASLGDAVLSRTSLRCRVGITRTWTWTAWITTEVMNRITFGLSPAPSMQPTSDKSGYSNNGSPYWSPVYDIVNAGPRHRFTVLTDRGPLIVHNCLGLGYQMGWSKFQATCEKFGAPIDEAFAIRVVDTYRQKFWRVKEMWQEQEQAAIAAVRTKKPQEAGRVQWFVQGRFLYCELPSGRLLAYPDPALKQKETPWGEMRTQLTYMGVDTYTRKWGRQATYGGMLVENITQAVSRDIMAEAMLRVEASGIYRVVLTIHDEIVAETNDSTGSVREFETLVSECPNWAAGCPVVAEGWNGHRYKK